MGDNRDVIFHYRHLKLVTIIFHLQHRICSRRIKALRASNRLAISKVECLISQIHKVGPFSFLTCFPLTIFFWNCLKLIGLLLLLSKISLFCKNAFSNFWKENSFSSFSFPFGKNQKIFEI